jgi:molybdopterin-containing oxidoreductase family iron-sulfur binding subunit
MNDDLETWYPDVNVRSIRWKMFYVYSNDTGDYFKLKREGREVVDGEFQTACSNACSNGAMTFGNDKGGKKLRN